MCNTGPSCVYASSKYTGILGCCFGDDKFHYLNECPPIHFIVVNLSQKEPEVSLISPVMNMKCRRILKGHRGRMLHFDWSPDKSHILTAGQVCRKIWGSRDHESDTIGSCFQYPTQSCILASSVQCSIVLASSLGYSQFFFNVYMYLHFKHQKTERRLGTRLIEYYCSGYDDYPSLLQDGHAIIWDGFSGQKEVIIQTTTPWVLACSYSPSTTLVACG